MFFIILFRACTLSFFVYRKKPRNSLIDKELRAAAGGFAVTR